MLLPFTLGVTVGIRLLYFKNRPAVQEYHNWIEKLDASSFPSLHTARIIFLAMTLSFFFEQEVVSIFLILLALSVAYSRVYLQKHDWMDLLGGLFLGIITYGLTSFFF